MKIYTMQLAFNVRSNTLAGYLDTHKHSQVGKAGLRPQTPAFPEYKLEEIFVAALEERGQARLPDLRMLAS